jgi:hydroxymethylbilane synthase
VTPRRLRLGTRRSALALAQSGLVGRELERLHPGLEVELVPLETRGDRIKGNLAKLGGKGLFTAELETGLLEGDLDLAVHSLKDLPVELPAGLTVAAFPERVDPRDVLVSEVASELRQLPAGAVLCTAALRRQAQILALRPDLRVEPVRGNVDTRLRKWRESGTAGVILAAAGLARLGISDVPAHPLEPQEMLPAPGQGILAVEVRQDTAAQELCGSLDHLPSRRAAAAERLVVKAFGGSCVLPLGAWAREESGRLRLSAMLATPDGRRQARGEAVAETPEEVASRCVARMRADGADGILEALEDA